MLQKKSLNKKTRIKLRGGSEVLSIEIGRGRSSAGCQSMLKNYKDENLDEIKSAIIIDDSRNIYLATGNYYLPRQYILPSSVMA
jgi:hypothetical protein